MAQLSKDSKSDRLKEGMKIKNEMEQPTLKDEIRDLREIREESTTSDLQGLIEVRSGNIMKKYDIPENKRLELEDIMINYAEKEIDINTAQRYILDLKN